ncbi:MAG TPA: methyltransferase domain-containing protein [Planctomycetaceae bacterium]|nr:methyltransferase domain-containing protein [Planctomycetaceae bacterium]
MGHVRAAVDHEYGVPVPGRVVDRAQWTRTALKKLPAEGPLDWEALFGRRAPVVLDIGCGNGRFLLASAIARPEMDHLGVDILPVVIRYATRRANQRGLTNVRWAVVGGHELLARYVSPHGAAEIHCYHPQPHEGRHTNVGRLVTPGFLALIHRALAPGGLFVIQTDNETYWQYIREVVPVLFAFEEHPGRWPDAPEGRTRREIYALKKGLPVFRGVGTARTDLVESDVDALAASLPQPDFRTLRPRRRPRR